MKCVCGYEYIQEYTEDGQEKILTGNVDFIYSEMLVPFKVLDKFGVKLKRIIICPKCGTLKIDI